jgi:hypothetical protein
VFLLCLKSYAHYKQEYRNNVSIIPIVAPPILHNNTDFQEEKVSDDNLYNINI